MSIQSFQLPLVAEQDHGTNDRKSSGYLAQLLSDKKQLQIFPPKMFIHLEKILDDGKYCTLTVLGCFVSSSLVFCCRAVFV